MYVDWNRFYFKLGYWNWLFRMIIESYLLEKLRLFSLMLIDYFIFKVLDIVGEREWVEYRVCIWGYYKLGG